MDKPFFTDMVVLSFTLYSITQYLISETEEKMEKIGFFQSELALMVHFQLLFYLV